MSQQDLNAFADWLVANPNKKGTPQYDTIAKAFQELDGQLNPKDTSFSSAFQSGVDAPLENMATTARMLGAEGTADTLSGLTQAPTNYESASDRFINPEEGDFTIAGFAPAYLPRASVEQAGQFAGSVATRVGGGAAGLAVSGGNPIVGAAGALAGPALFEFVQQLGPVAAQRAKNNGRTEPNWEDWTAAAGTAGLSGALNSIGVKGFSGAGLLNRTLKEGVTETAQSVVEQTGSTAGTDAGLQINPKQAIGEGIIGGTSAGGVSVASDTVSGAANLTGRGLRAAKDAVVPSDTPSDAEAAADFAADLQRVSDEDGYNLKDVDTGSATGARAAVDTLHMEYGSQIEVMVSDLVDRLKETADDTQLQALEKAKANAAKRKAKNKVKSRVDPTDFQVIQKLTAGTDEGAKLIALMRKSNELSALANKSVKGGISQFTDVFNPLDSDGRYNIGRAIAAPVSGLGAIASGGASLAPAIAGRAIDAVTGRRSRVANYVKQNQGNQGIQIPNLPSERTRKQQEQAAKDQAALAEEERKKALALEATQLNDPPKGFSGDQTPSPQYAMETGTGLTRRGVADALKVLRRTRPKLSKAIDTYQTMLETGQQSDDLTPLIRAVKGLRKKYPQLFENTQGETDNSAAVPASTTESPNIKRGIESNLKFAQDQINKVDADNTMNDFDKMVAKEALRELSTNLGSDPVASAEGILKKAKVKARKKPKIDEHVKPYVDRVKRQQKQAKKSDAVTQENLDQQPFEPFLNEELMGRPLNEREIQFNEMERGINQLRNDLDSMLMRPGEGMLKSRKKSDDIGNLQYDFDWQKAHDYKKRTIKEAVAMLDPEGRLVISDLQVGLNGQGGMSPEEIGVLIPSVVRSLKFISGDEGTARGAFGSYAATRVNDKITRDQIKVVDLNQTIGRKKPVKMHSKQFLNTLLHETGHAIGAKSNLDKLMTDLMNNQGSKSGETYYKIMDQASDLSRIQRPEIWSRVEENIDAIRSRTGYYLGPARQSYQLNLKTTDDVKRILGEVFFNSDPNLDLDADGLASAIEGTLDQIRYLNSPRELVADAVAYYLQKPKQMKELYPDLAKLVRDGVNESSVAEHITFHSLAGLLGAAGMMAAVQAAMTGEDDEERPGILNLLQPQGILQQASI